MIKEKEYLYIGHYEDIQGRYILKIGTTNDLDRRKQEHTRNYKKVTDKGKCKMRQDGQFTYDWFIPLSKYNTLRYEDKNRSKWIEDNIGEYVANDRFVLAEKPTSVTITIRKTYTVAL